jgi:hypothetical protein
LIRVKLVNRGNNAAGAQAVKGLEPRAPEHESPRPMGAGVGAGFRPPFWGAAKLAKLASLALRGDGEAVKALLARALDPVEQSGSARVARVGVL